MDAVGRELGGTTVTWVPLGQLGRCITALRAGGATQAVMAGQVRHAKIFGGVLPDLTLLSVLSRLRSKNTDALIAAIAVVLKDHGITLLDSTALLKDLLARPGVLSRAQPDSSVDADFAFAYRVADTIAGLDIGQTIIVKDRAVVAVEAMEGTDQTIERAGRLAGQRTRVIKVAKPSQDMRFDVPVVGVATVRAMVAAGADAISIDADLTLIVDGVDFVTAADEAGIVVVGRSAT
jgi:DUF1009 family protein